MATGRTSSKHEFPDVSVIPHWIPVGEEYVAAWLHLPRDLQARRTGVLICPPAGYEYTHTHRTLRRLATELAAAGFVTLRIDLPGTGDSTGDEMTPDLFALWTRALDVAADRLDRLVPDGVSVLGVRLGAALAGVLAQRREVVDFVAWNPVVRGRTYVREQEALRRVAGLPRREPDGVLEAGGFRLSEQTASSLSALSLLDGTYRIGRGALIVERSDLESGGKLESCLTEQGVAISAVSQDDYLDMVAEPQYTVIPTGTIDHIRRWLVRDAAESREAVDPTAVEQIAADVSVERRSISETMVEIPIGPTRRLFGILSGPASDVAGPILVLPNAGSVHHVGPNRFYVELARALAAAGLPTVRIDLRNLGDSVPGPCRNENHPYPESAVADMGHALDWLAEQLGQDRFVVAGLCSGAHTAFHAGLEVASQKIIAIVPINPLTFYWHSGMSLDTPDSHQTIVDAKYYGQAIKDPRKWGRLLRGRSNLPHISRFLGRRMVQLTAQAGRRTLERTGLMGSSPLARDLRRMADAGCTIHFVFSSSDPGYEILTAAAGREVDRLAGEGALGITMIQEADHTFSRRSWRDEAIQAVLSWASTTLSRER